MTWFESRTWQSPQWTVPELMRAKGSRTVSVVLPALDEEATVGGVVRAVLPLLGSVVDECVVVDSGSTDRTASVATAAGARVVHRGDVLPDLVPRPGKGAVLWRSIAATSGDVLVFLDSDLVDPDPGFVTALLGPILGVPVSGNQVHGLVRANLEGPAILSGGTFGLEASIIAIAVCTTAGIWFLWLAVRRGEIVQPWWTRRRRLNASLAER